MKKYSIAIMLMVMIVSCIGLCGCGRNNNGNGSTEDDPIDTPSSTYTTLLQKNDYVQSIQTILSPDCGFYRPMVIKLTTTGGTCSHINNDVSVQHLRVNIGAFSKAVNNENDIEFTDEALDYFDSIMKNLLKNNKSAIVRFAYDGFNGVADLEPSEDMILRHIEQLCSVLNKYQDTVTAIEVGMVGKWGEMHTSKLANYDTIDKLISKFLSCTDNYPILVRTPKMIYHYLNITINDIDNYDINANTLEYRLGIFNDGYLGSGNDLGTYTNREKEIDWLSKQTAHLPFGGEVMTGEMSNIENCLEEMNKINLSYLNYEWNYNTTQTKWNESYYTSELGQESLYYNTKAVNYIRNHLGYRLVLENCNIKREDNTNNYSINIGIKNIGFGNLTRTKQSQIIFVNTQTSNIFTFDCDDYKGGDITYNLSANLDSGEYEVYLKLFNGLYDNQSRYEIQLSNENIFDTTLRANLLGTINI